MTQPPPPSSGNPSDDRFGAPTYSRHAAEPAPPPTPPPPTGYTPPPPTMPPPPPSPQTISPYDAAAPWNHPVAPASPYNAPQVEVTAPVVGWLVPVAALLAVIGAFTPWFDPSGSMHGQTVLQAQDKLYSWKDGRIGLLAPIVLVILAVGVVNLLRGSAPTRFTRGSSHPVVSAGRGVLIAGVVAAVCLVVAWFLVPGQYDDVPSDAGGSWSGAEKMGIDMSRGPQIGYWLTVVGTALAIVTGILMMVLKGKETPAGPLPGMPPPPGYGTQTPGAPGPQGYGNPGFGTPGHGQPGFGQPGYGTPGHGQQNSGTPPPPPYGR